MSKLRDAIKKQNITRTEAGGITPSAAELSGAKPISKLRAAILTQQTGRTIAPTTRDAIFKPSSSDVLNASNFARDFAQTSTADTARRDFGSSLMDSVMDKSRMDMLTDGGLPVSKPLNNIATGAALKSAADKERAVRGPATNLSSDITPAQDLFADYQSAAPQREAQQTQEWLNTHRIPGVSDADQERVRAQLLAPRRKIADEVNYNIQKEALKKAADIETSKKKEKTSFIDFLAMAGFGGDSTNPFNNITVVTNELRNSPAQVAYEKFIAAETEAEKQEQIDRMRAWAKEHPILAGAASIATSPLSGADYINRLVQQNAIGTTLPTSTPSLTEVTANLRDGAMEDRNELDRFLYNTILSGVDSLIAGVVGGSPVAGGVILGFGAASNTADDIKKRGGTDEQALLGGALAGIFEGVFEKVSLGNLKMMKEAPMDGVKTLVENAVKSTVVNASEEAATEIANIVMDYYLMGELSNYTIAVEQYMAGGMSESEARAAAKRDMFAQIGVSAASGALMGAGNAVVGSVGSYVGERGKSARSASKVVSERGSDSGQEGAENAPAAAETGQKSIFPSSVPEPGDFVETVMRYNREQQAAAQARQNEKTAAETQRSVSEENAERKEPGFYRNDRFGGTDKDAEYLDRLAKAAGISIEMAEAKDGSNGWITNGEVHLSENAGDPLRVVAKHEITHHLKDAAGETYDQYRSYVEQIYRERGTLEQQIEAVQRLYRKNGTWLSRDAALDELAADYAGELMDNESLIRKLAGEDKGLAQRILDGIRDLIRRVKTAFGSDEVKRLDRAARLWEDALRETNEAYQRGEVAVNPNIRWSAANEYDPETSSIKEQLENSREMLNGMDVVVRLEVPTNLNSKKEATKWAVELLAHTNYQVDTKDFGVIRFNKDDINDAMNYADTPEEKAAIAALPRVLKRGVEIGRHENHKGRNKQTITIGAPVELNGQRGNMAVVISQYKNHYETHRIVLPDGSAFKFSDKKTDTTQEPSRGVTDSGSLAKTTSVVSGESVSQNRQSVKGSRDLQKQIDALERQNQRLKEQMKRTDIPQQNRKAVENTANSLAKEYRSKIDRKALADRLETLYDSIYQKSENKGIWSGKGVLTWEEIRAETRSIANDILDRSTAYASPLYREYGKLRNRIRNEALTIAAKDREELQYFGYDGYEDFRKRNAKRLTLTEDGRSVESMYRELNEENPDLFPDDMFTPAEQLNRISEVLADLDALARDPYAFDREKTLEFLAGEIEERFYQTEHKKLTFADKEEQKRQKMRQSDKRLFEAELYAVGRKHEREVKAVQQRYAEANRKRIENQNAAQRRETIYRHANRLANKLLRPTNKQHVPEELRGAAYNLLKYINLESGYELSYGKGATYRRVLKDTELDAEPNSRTLAAIELKKKLEEMAGKKNMTIAPDMGDYLSEIALMGNKTLQQMTRAELDTVWKVMQIVEHTINRANELHEQWRYDSLRAMATALATANKDKRDRKDYVKAVGALDKLVNFDMLSPETFFHKLGKPGDEIYRMMRRAADRQTGIYNEGVSKAQKLIEESGADFTKLDKEFHGFDFSGKRKITLSKSQIMELYALSRREQARDHIEKGGLKAVGAAKGFVEQSNVQPVKVSWAEVEQITSKLTDKEKKLVEGLQAYLSNELSKHGNEETMKVYGIEKFKEKFYWPIKVSGTETESSPSKAAHAKTIPGYGMTENVEQDASNAVELHSAIDTFSNHLNQMATYAAWLGTNEDITRLINFQYDSVENGTENTVKRILATVYGKNGEKYINDLLGDIAQGTKAGQDRTLSDNLTSQWKAAKVGGNLRVVVQQPTAILRAMTMLDPKYMVASVNAKAGWEKAKKYAPIAQWKDWGYFEIGTGRSLRELIVGTENGIDKVKNSFMWAAGAMDSASWGYLWNAVERETADKRSDLAKGSEDFYKAVADRFSEIIDRTQVVDSVLHRTQIMRSGNALNKMATNFMSEPSKIYNMVARDLYDIVDANSEEAKKRAYKALLRSSSALITSFAVNALMQSLIDGFRDDDRDKKYGEKFAESYFGITGDEESFEEYYESFWSGNFWQNFNPFSYVPYVKDALSIAQGYEVDRSDMAAISDLANALQQLMKSISGEGQKSLLTAGMDAAAKLGDLLGIPVSNLKRAAAAVVNTVLNEFGLYELRYELDKIVYNEENATGVFYGDLYRTMNNDYEAYEDIYEDMYEGLIERGYEKDEAADKISDAMENKMKKDLGVESVKSLPVRYSPPTTDDKEDPFYALLKKARENDANWVEALDPGSIEIALAVDSIRDAKTLEKIRMVAEQPYGEDLKRLAMRNFMGDSQWGRYLSALNAGVSSRQFAEFLEAIAKEAQRRTGKEDANPSQADILAVLEKSKLNSKQKRAIWNGYGWKAESPW